MHHDPRASTRHWGRDPQPLPRKLSGAAQAVTTALLCWEQREAGLKADLLKLFF